MPKSPNVGPKPVDNGRLGGTPTAPGLGWGTTPTGGGGGIGWGSASPAAPTGQAGLGAPGGLQGLLGDLRGGLGGAQPSAPAGQSYGSLFQDASNYYLKNGGTQANVDAYRAANPGQDYGKLFNDAASWYMQQPGYSGGVADYWAAQNPFGSPRNTGDMLMSPASGGAGGAPAPRTGVQLGNRGAQKRMGGTAAPRTAVDTNWESPGSSTAPPPPMPGVTSDPGPAGGGLQSLLARARAMSPYGRG